MMIKLCGATIAINLLMNSLMLASAQPSRTNTPPPQSPPPAYNTNFTSFVTTVAAGVTIAVVSKGCEYCLELAFGDKEKRKADLQIQQDKVMLSQMAMIHEFCKDEMHKDTCQQLKQLYLEAQIQQNKNKHRM